MDIIRDAKKLKDYREAYRELVSFTNKELNKDFFGSGISPFVGEYNYPNINVGVLSPPRISKDAWLYDAQNYWQENNFEIEDVISLRSSIINSRFRNNVKRPGKLLEISQEIGMSSRPVDLEINLKDKPKFNTSFDAIMKPIGPRASLVKAKLMENPKINKKVDKVVDDIDLRAKDAMLYLYKNKFEDDFLSKILSIGVLGRKKDRKLVPTKWSITATHSTLGDNIADEIKKYNAVNDFMLFEGSYMGNYYYILMLPDVWNYELFEVYLPRSSWNNGNKVMVATNYEGYFGRKQYAKETAGGFYAARLSVLEKLKELKKQASVLVIRVETEEYWAGLGVWVVLASGRKSLANKYIKFDTKEKLLEHARKKIKERFGYDTDVLYKESKLLGNAKEQVKLREFF